MATTLELFEYQLHHQGKSPHTVRSYLSKIKYFLDWQKEKYNQITPMIPTATQVKKYVSYCEQVKGYSANSIRQRLSAIHSYYDFMTAAGKQTKPIPIRGGHELATKEKGSRTTANNDRSLARLVL